MANRYFDPFAGLSQVGARIGGAIQQKGQQRYLTMFQQMQQEEERKYQESLPQYKMAEEKLRDMEKQAKIAANFIKAKSEITPFLTKSWLNKIIEQKEEEELYGMASQYPGEVGTQLYGWLGEEIESRREAESKRQLRGVQTTRLKQPPTPTPPKSKVLSPTQQFKVQGRLNELFQGIPSEYYKLGDKIKEEPAKPGFVEKYLHIPYNVVISPGYNPGIEDRTKIWRLWNSRRGAESPAVRKAGDEWMANYFGSDPTGRTEIGLRKDYTPEEKQLLIRAKAEDKEAIAELQRRGII